MTWLSKIIALCVLFSILYLVLPEGGVKRSAGTVMTIILALQIISPFFSFNFNQVSAWFLSVEEETLIDENGSEDLTQIFDTYESKCVEAIKAYVEKADDVKSCDVKVVVNRDPNSKRVGYIEHVYLYVLFGEKENNSNFIKPIEILPLDRWEDQEKYTKRHNELIQDVSTWLFVDHHCITVFDKEDSYA